MTGRLRPAHFVALAALLCNLSAPAAASDIVLKNAWMRPEQAGAAKAGVYVDIRTDVPLTLVGVTTPVAKSVAIVLVDQNSDGTTTERTVKELDLPGGRETRFAYNGSRLELREITETLSPGASVGLKLQFVEQPDRRVAVEINVLVRGVMLPPEPGSKSN
jgi:periplasmic copper chaperone A